MKTILKIAALSVVMLMFVGGSASCKKEKDDFCSYFEKNMKDINKTIPLINNFLKELPDNLNDEQKKEKLRTWMMSHSCGYFVDYYSESGLRAISATFPESGLYLMFSETRPLKAICWTGERTEPIKFNISRLR